MTDTKRVLAAIGQMRDWRRDGGLGRRHATLALDVAEAAARLFAALDYVDPYWRDMTLGQGADGDAVNAAWDALNAALAALGGDA